MATQSSRCLRLHRITRSSRNRSIWPFLVPRTLARLLCANNCAVTRNFSLLVPGNDERKYYAPGIGVFLEVTPDSGEVVQLVKCNVDPRCAALSP